MASSSGRRPRQATDVIDLSDDVEFAPAPLKRRRVEQSAAGPGPSGRGAAAASSVIDLTAVPSPQDTNGAGPASRRQRPQHDSQVAQQRARQLDAALQGFLARTTAALGQPAHARQVPPVAFQPYMPAAAAAQQLNHSSTAPRPAPSPEKAAKAKPANDDDDGSIKCAVCLDPIRDSASSLPCGHVYHEACAKECLKKWKRCPRCRKSCNEKQLRKIYL